MHIIIYIDVQQQMTMIINNEMRERERNCNRKLRIVNVTDSGVLAGNRIKLVSSILIVCGI